MPTVPHARVADPATSLQNIALSPIGSSEPASTDAWATPGHARAAAAQTQWPVPSAAEQRMYDAIMRSNNRTSIYPLCSFALASGGKLVLAIGAGLTVSGSLAEHPSTRNCGIALVALGFSGALTAAIMFAQDVKTINYKLGWILKCCSVSAAALIGAGYGLRGYGLATQDLTTERCAVLLLTTGLSAMTVTLPWFVTHSEARRGLIPLRPREPVRVGCMASGAGILFGWAVCASSAQYPVPASQTVLTVGTMLLTLGIALSTSDIVHQAAYGAVTHAGLRVGQQADAFSHVQPITLPAALQSGHTG